MQCNGHFNKVACKRARSIGSKGVLLCLDVTAVESLFYSFSIEVGVAVTWLKNTTDFWCC